MYEITVAAAVRPSWNGTCVKFVNSSPNVVRPTVKTGMPFFSACCTSGSMLLLPCGSIDRQSTWFTFSLAWIWLICVFTSC